MSVLLLTCLLVGQVHAHGTHSWFESPAEGAGVATELSLLLKTGQPVKHKYVHVTVVPEGEQNPVWEGLVPRDGLEFATSVSVEGWQQGAYRVEAVLVGDVFPHPRTRKFFVRRTRLAEDDSANLADMSRAEDVRLAANIPLKRIQEISEYLMQPENKVKAQLPSAETQYGWQHMSKYGPTAQILRSGNVRQLDTSINSDIGKIIFSNKKGERRTVDAHLQEFPVDAFIVVRAGQVVFEKYKTMRPEDKHIWFSVSKVIGSTLAALLQEEGKLDVTLPVTSYLPELSGSAWGAVSVAAALDMATGLNGTEHDEPEADARSNPQQIWYRWAASLGILADVEGRQQSWVEVLRGMQSIRPSFEVYEYNSINTFVVNRIVERVSGRPLHELASERIWQKAGMGNDAYILVSPGGLSLGFMGMNSTLRDMARFGVLFTPSWQKVSDEQLVTDAVMKIIQDRVHPEMFDKGWAGDKFSTSFPDVEMFTNRYQWDAVLEDGDFYKSGVGGQGLYISPGTDTVVAWFCTGTGYDQEETMAREIVKALK